MTNISKSRYLAATKANTAPLLHRIEQVLQQIAVAAFFLPFPF
jgi:hypothetical protein